jgi:hypothetical protein
VLVPRFFFDTFDGDRLVPDEEGLELEDLEAAKLEAQTTLPHIAKDKLTDSNKRVFMVSVRDESEQVVMWVALTMIVEYAPRASK